MYFNGIFFFVVEFYIYTRKSHGESIDGIWSHGRGHYDQILPLLWPFQLYDVGGWYVSDILATKTYIHRKGRYHVKEAMPVFLRLLVMFFQLVSVVRFHNIYKLGPVDLELVCVISLGHSQIISNVRCAVMTSFTELYNYAFTVHEGQCYVCRAVDDEGTYRTKELILRGPHFIKGINSSLPRQNGHHFTDGFFKIHFYECKATYFLFEVHWCLFLRAQLTIIQHWFR